MPPPKCMVQISAQAQERWHPIPPAHVVWATCLIMRPSEWHAHGHTANGFGPVRVALFTCLLLPKQS